MSAGIRVHLTCILEATAVPTMATARHRWDPVMARGVPPHVTLVYPEEFSDEGLLIDRAETAASQAGPFAMHSDHVVAGGGDGSGGVFASVVDPTGSWAQLRQQILVSPFTPKEVAPHITVVHPRTSDRGVESWAELGASRHYYEFVVHEFCLTATSVADGMRVRRRFELAKASVPPGA